MEEERERRTIRIVCNRCCHVLDEREVTADEDGRYRVWVDEHHCTPKQREVRFRAAVDTR